MAFKIVRNDITKISADAIVNTANPEPVYREGTDSAVYIAAGADRLLEERKKIGRIGEGCIAVTPAFDLDAKYIFHTVGPVWTGGGSGERETVRKCYLNCLNKAKELGLESIAFPLISTGIYGFPKADALLIATSVFSGFLAENEMEITLVVFDSESFMLSDKIFSGVDQYIDENYVEERFEEEYYGAAACEDSLGGESLIEDRSLENSPRRSLFGRNRKNLLRRGRNDAAAMEEQAGSDAEEAYGAAPAGYAAQGMAARCAPPEVLPGAEMQGAYARSAPRSLEDVVKNISETWSESLLRLITEKGYTDTEVYKRANVDRKLFSKIRSNKDYQPKKNTAVAFALALRLNPDETRDFLRRAGYAFSPSSKFDLIIEYSIDHGIYDLMLINGALFDHDLPQLGA